MRASFTFVLERARHKINKGNLYGMKTSSSHTRFLVGLRESKVGFCDHLLS